MHIEMPKGHLFVFDYGVLVTWGVNPAKQEQYLTMLKEIAKELNPLQINKYQFVKADKGATQLVRLDDKLVLPNVQVDSLLALSHAFAQSAKLHHFESRAEQRNSNSQYLTTTLAKTGTISLSRNALGKLRGQLFQLRGDIFVHYRLLDAPEFIWSSPAVEHLYFDLSRYLEIKPRIEVLNRKLQSLHDLHEMFADELRHKQTAFFGWLTLMLITTIIVLLVFN